MAEARDSVRRPPVALWTMLILPALILISEKVRTSDCASIRQAVSLKHNSPQGVLFGKSYLLLESHVKSLSTCAATCALFIQNCNVFTFAKSAANLHSGICRGHSTFDSETTPQPEASSFIVVESTDWLNKGCSSNSDCPALNSVCFGILCLCSPGYYYSITLNLCVPTCASSDLQDSFLEYANSSISGHNMEMSSQSTLLDCKARCLQLGGCLTIDYQASALSCAVQGVTALDVLHSFVAYTSGYNYYQRTCK